MEQRKLIGLISLVVAIVFLIFTSLSVLGLYLLDDVFNNSSTKFSIFSHLFMVIRLVPLYFAYFSIRLFKGGERFKYLNAKILLLFVILNILHMLFSYSSKSYFAFQYTSLGAHIVVSLLVLYAISLMLNSLFLVVKEEKEFKKKSVLLIFLLTFLTFECMGLFGF